MEFKILLSVLLCVSIVHSTSNADPALIYDCDASTTLWGCEPRFWINGDRKNCANKTTQHMSWATKTIKSDCYHIIAGDEANPETHYVPNEYVQIHVRVTCYKMQYRGLLLYAVNAAKQRVGEWDIPLNEPPLFSQPWQSIPTHECAKTVMHSSAEWKPYHSVLYFKAPPAGTGPITFLSLFKYGNANTGDFFWPMNNIVLQEGTPVENPVTWSQSAPGQSCSEACGEKYCSPDDLVSLNSEQAVVDKIIPSLGCQVPILSGCGQDGATFEPSTEYCYYVDADCTSQNRAASSVTCDTKADGVVRLCPCSEEDMSPASHNGPSILAIFLAIPLIFAGLNQRVVFGILLLTGLQVAFGHNWINSLSRSPAASTYRPCKPPLSDMPHAQVGPRQAFQIEWMNGHGDFAYFVIINAVNVAKLKLHTTAMLNDYIAGAPNGTNQAQQETLQKFHLKSVASLNNEATENPQTDYFEGFVYANSSKYITRPLVFGATGLKYQLEYKPAQIANDVRVSYQSAKYPWIEAVYKFQITTMDGGRPDTANFYIPGFGGPGRYIVQYLWRGYYDCTDVDFKAAPVASVYGLPFNGTRWNRIDHCLFEQVQRVFHQSRIVTDPKYCLNLCTSGECYGVNVVPIMAPPTAARLTMKFNNTWMYPGIYGADMYVPWSDGMFNNTRDLFTANPSPNKWMCYTVRPRDFTDTTDEYTVSNDPEDPIFYSTCFYRYRGNLFEEYLNKTAADSVLPWRYSDGCIDCPSRTAGDDASNFFPKWNVPAKCINCDKEPAPAKVTPPQTLVETGVRCDGFLPTWSKLAHHTCPNNGTICLKNLKAVGRGNNVVSLAECEAFVREDSECSSTFMYRAGSSLCTCYTNNPCCKTCSRRPDTNYNTYETTSVADPTCTRGIKSLDNTACCSGSCGVGNCANATVAIDPVGFCCSSCATRPCAQFGPPCKL